MKSYWKLVCDDSRSAILVLKFERPMGVKLIAPEIERLVRNNKKLEVIDFFIDHPMRQQWDELLVDALEIATKIPARWSISLDNERLHAAYAPAKNGEIAPISGLQSASWTILASQDYQRTKWKGAAVNGIGPGDSTLPGPG